MRNRLLALMSGDDFAVFAPQIERVALDRGFVLAEPGRRIESIYFPDSGLVSIVTVSRDGAEAEAGVFGFEGVGSLSPVLGSESTPNRVFVQIPGDGWRINASAFVAAVDASAGLRKLILRFQHTLSIQITYTAMTNATHPIEERLARWLLMCDDRVAGAELLLTHEFLSVMLAVRRPSVTTSLHVLEGGGFIWAERGRIAVRNRAGLEDFAGDVYGVPEAEYRRLIGPLNGC